MKGVQFSTYMFHRPAINHRNKFDWLTSSSQIIRAWFVSMFLFETFLITMRSPHRLRLLFFIRSGASEPVLVAEISSVWAAVGNNSPIFAYVGLAGSWIQFPRFRGALLFSVIFWTVYAFLSFSGLFRSIAFKALLCLSVILLPFSSVTIVLQLKCRSAVQIYFVVYFVYSTSSNSWKVNERVGPNDP